MTVQKSGILPGLTGTSSRKPDRAPAPIFPILDDVGNDLEVDAAEQRCVFVWAQAGVIQRVASVLSHAFAVVWPAVEYQHGGRREVSGEDAEHPTLVVRREVKEAIPGKHPIKSTGKA